MKMRTIFVGDIHGCYREFMLLLGKIKYNDKHDRLILLGDLINKGPDSKKVLEFVKENKVEFILGNHEYGFINSLNENKNSFIKLKNQLGDQVIEWKSFLESKPFYIDEKHFLAIHAGVIPNSSLETVDKGDLLNLRIWNGRPWYDYYKDEKLIIYGHWAAKGLSIGKNRIGLDSGCVWGGALSAFCIEEKKIYQQKALTQYVDPKFE